MNKNRTRRDPRGQRQECCGKPDEKHPPLTEDQPESRPPTDLGPGNEGKEWARRYSETEMMKQGNRQPALRGAQSPGVHRHTADEDDLPEWLRIKEGEVAVR